MSVLDRRRLLLQAAALAGGALTPAAAAPSAYGRTPPDDPFTLGVASGEPTSDGVVLWTRLAPRPLDPDGGMPARSVPVGWEVAEDPRFRRLAARGRAHAGPAAGHALHVEVDGLKPGREYWYRFTTPAGASPIGRTVTAPRADADAAALRIAFASCQKYEAGYYAAYRQMVEDHPDLIFFLGDYIYEKGPGSKDAVRLHQNPEPMDVAGYRVRYATYKTDRLLQAAHAAAPWMVTWDDHEVSNDYGADLSETFNAEFADGARGFLRRRAAAYQAYYEHMPLRRRARPVGPDMLLHRSLDWGRLAQFQFVDDRQHRSPRACRAMQAEPGKVIPECDERRDPARSMLGRRQEQWLLETLTDSRARWNVLCQQTLFAPLELRDPSGAGPVRWSSDGWDGSPATRERIVARWQDAKVSNPLVLGGDIHAFAAAEVRARGDGPVVAPAFVGSSISSLGSLAAEQKRFQAANPHLKVYDASRRGYGLVDISANATRVAFRRVDDARLEASAVRTWLTYDLEAGRPAELPS
jgi:alkaline phosphatase D